MDHARLDDTEDDGLLRGITEAVSEIYIEKLKGRKPLRHAPAGSQDEAWKKYFEVAETYDSGMCQALHQQIDTVLVFAGLFSAVVTAFTVESYQWLYDDSGDATVELLAGIANAMAQDRGRANVSTPDTSPMPDSQAALINTYWFLALLLSLSSAFVAILAKQWISEYERRYRQSYRDGLAVRQAKLEGLETWRVEGIATSLPLLLLQAALVLFFVGVLELLWALDRRVAVPAIVGSSVLAAFYLATSLLPALQLLRWVARRRSESGLPAQRPSPYKSPQAGLVIWVVAGLIWCADWLRRGVRAIRQRLSDNAFLSPYMAVRQGPELPERRRTLRPLLSARSWVLYDHEWVRLCESEPAPAKRAKRTAAVDYAYDALAWLLTRFDPSDLASWVWHCLWTCVTSNVDDESDAASATMLLSSDAPPTAPPGEGDRHFDNMLRVLKCIALPDISSMDPPAGCEPPLRRLILLINYANVTEAAPGLIFELLHLAQRAALAQGPRIRPPQSPKYETGSDNILSPYWMLDIIQGAAERCSAQNVDDATCEFLVAILSQHELWAGAYAFMDAVRAALPVLGMGQATTERRKVLTLAICPVARGWLQCYRSSLWGSLVMLDLYEILVRVGHLLGIHHVDDLVPAAQSTRIMAALAIALDDLWRAADRPLQLEEYIRSSSSPTFADVFLQLVGTASARTDGGVQQPNLEQLREDELEEDSGFDYDTGPEPQSDVESHLASASSASVGAQTPADTFSQYAEGVRLPSAKDIAQALATGTPPRDAGTSVAQHPGGIPGPSSSLLAQYTVTDSQENQISISGLPTQGDDDDQQTLFRSDVQPGRSGLSALLNVGGLSQERDVELG